jgi:hypothetical protein
MRRGMEGLRLAEEFGHVNKKDLTPKPTTKAHHTSV